MDSFSFAFESSALNSIVMILVDMETDIAWYDRQSLWGAEWWIGNEGRYKSGYL